MAVQIFVPGDEFNEGVMLNETGTVQIHVPGTGSLVNETVAAAAAGVSFPPWKTPITHLLTR